MKTLSSLRRVSRTTLGAWCRATRENLLTDMSPRQAPTRPSVDEAKRQVLTALRAGRTWDQAMHSVGRSPRSQEAWLRDDAWFREEVRAIRAVQKHTPQPGTQPKISFTDWRRRYLNIQTFPHQQNMIDVIEGREPGWLHPSMRYEKADKDHILINIPPDHAKTSTISVDYVTYLLATNPNERIVIVSKTQPMSNQMLWAVKQRLTHPNYKDLQLDYGPPEGFNSGDAIWQATRIYLPSESRSPLDKDPNLQSLGIGGQIYGARTTKIILDDSVLLSNAHEFEKQIRWLQQDVMSRGGHTGQVIVVGTRVDAIDLYQQLRDTDRYEDGKSPWTYLGMPAVLQFADRPSDWVTLWPRSDQPWHNSEDLPDPDGLYPRWDGARLKRRRGLIDPKTWSMVYQQQDVSSDAIFDPKVVRACINGNRTAGVLSGTNKFHDREEGMDGLHVICSMDPAMSGETATIAYALDPRTLQRWVLDAHRMRAPSPQAMREIIKEWTVKYSPVSWVIEKNAFQIFLTRDPEIRQFLASRGVSLLEHYTGSNKLDPDFGVASLAPLFSEQMISLPSTHNSEGVKALVEQLITWRPGVKGKDLTQDLPMAVWFAELKAREIVDARTMRANSHASNKHVPRYRRGHQNVLHIDRFLREVS